MSLVLGRRRECEETGMSPSVVVVGAGIGGLTTAVALQRAGIEVTVLERAPELREVGAGLSLWPNAVAALRRIGLGPAVEQAGARVRRTELRDWRGHVIHASSTEDVEARFGAPVLMVHRADLLAVLRAALDQDAVQLGVEVAAVEQDGAGVRVHRTDGQIHSADVAIGADGLHSVVRAAVLADGLPTYSGLTAWRAVVKVDDEVAGRVTAGETWGDGSIFGMQSLPGNRVYWYAAMRAPEGARARRGMEKEALVEQFGSWHVPILEVIGATPDDVVLRTDLYDRSPTQRLASGRVALLGDAAHPMLPYLGQGACQAIVDGVVLAQEVARTDDPVPALAGYSRKRQSQTAAAVTQSRLMSRVAHVRPLPAVVARNVILRVTPPKATVKRLGPILSSDLEPSRDPELDWPAAASRRVELDGQVHYLDFGGPQGAQTLLCVHGLGGSALNFGAFGPLLTDTYRVLALDLHAHGRSAAGPPGAGGAETVALLVHQIARFAHEVAAGPIVLVGHSLGGVLSVLHTLQTPAGVDRLVLLDPPVPHQTRSPLDLKLLAKLGLLQAPGVRGVVARQTLRASPEELVRRQLSDATPYIDRVPTEAVAASVVETRWRASQPDAVVAQRLQWNAILGTIGILVHAQQWRAQLDGISPPTLWLQGEDDLLAPSQDARAFAVGRPGRTYASRAGVGHLPHLEDPVWAAETLGAWLREQA